MAARRRPLVRVIGAGVVGCTCALTLAESGRYDVVVTARDLPGDVHSQAFASPWAGGHWRSGPKEEPRLQRWETLTLERWLKMIPEHPESLLKLDITIYLDEAMHDDPWYKDVVKGYRRLEKDEVPSGYVDGYVYEGVSFVPTVYLGWLQSELVRLGVKVERRHLQSLDEAFSLPADDSGATPDVVINCTGLGAKGLGGVQDQDVQPIKGQTILVRTRPGYAKGFMAGDFYIIPRADGTACLGGCKRVDDWSLSLDTALAEQILQHCRTFDPEIGTGDDGPLEIVSHNVGLRPGRRGGPRLEAEAHAPGGKTVIHAYGIGASGYMASWGMAEDVLKLADQATGRK